MSKVSKEELSKLKDELALAKEKVEALEYELGKVNRITELVKDLVITADDKGFIKQTSHALNSTLGYNLQDIAGTNISSLVHPDDKLPFEVFFKKLNTSSTSSLLHRIKTHSGKFIWIETSCRKSTKWGADLIFYLRDLSDKMRLESDLVLSHQRYKSLIENLPFVLFRYDRLIRHVYVSPNVSDILPFEPDELMGSRFEELGFEQEKVDFFKKAILEVLQSGKKIEKEFEQETHKGNLFLSWKLIPEFNRDKKVETVLGILEDVTKLRKVQREKYSSEEKFRSIFNTIPDAVVLSRAEDGQLLDVNDGFLTITGFSREEVINRTTVEIGLFSDEDSRMNFISRLEKGPLLNEETTFYTSDKKSIQVLISSTPIKLFGEELLISVFKDVSDIRENQRRLSETMSELQETEGKFDHFVEQSPDGIIVIDEEGRIGNWNRKMEELTGFPRERVIQKEWKETYDFLKNRNRFFLDENEASEEALNHFLSGKTGERKIKVETGFAFPGRSIVYLETILFKIDVRDKIRYGIISRDITQEKQSREQVLLYKDIYLNNEDGIAILNNDGTYREVNRAYTSIVGYDTQELEGKDPSLLIGKRIHSEVSKVFDFQGIFDGELQAFTKNKEQIYLDYLLFPVNKEDETLCIVQIIRDITQRKEAEVDLIEAKRRAENADKLKTAFLSNMSHEIRTPMNSILGFSTLLANPKITTEQRIKYIEFINKNGENLLNLIGDIIDIAKIESNQLRIKKSACNLNYLVKEISESLQKVKELEGKKKVELRHSFNENIIISVFTDCHRLRQIIINLVFNAIKFTHEGFIEFGYLINEEKREILFHVKDTGIGIPEDMQEKIFERFHKNETTIKKSYGGAGLGLAISSQLVKLLGGKIWLESYVGKGTTFYFTIPYVRTHENIKSSQAGPLEDFNFNWESKKILIVEDDIFSSELVAEFLSETNIEIVYARNGKKAVEYFSVNKDIDIIVMDVRLPEMSGIEATKLIREIKPDIPVIAQTAFAMEEDRAKAKSAGFDEYLVKPLNKKEFLSIVSKYLAK